MSEWKVERTTRYSEIGTTIEYLRSGHGHEGAHAVLLPNGDKLIVYPTATTTSLGRSRVILTAIGDTYGVEGINMTAYVIGMLHLLGATEIELNGERLGPEGGHGEWRVNLYDDGTVKATYKGDPT